MNDTLALLLTFSEEELGVHDRREAAHVVLGITIGLKMARHVPEWAMARLSAIESDPFLPTPPAEVQRQLEALAAAYPVEAAP